MFVQEAFQVQVFASLELIDKCVDELFNAGRIA